MMRIFKTVCTVFFFTPLFIVLQTSNALANQPPGPQTILALIVILPIMVLFTFLGGGYSILKLEENIKLKSKTKRKKERKQRIWKYFPSLLAVLAVIFSAAHVGIGVLVLIIFGMIAVARGFSMIFWGIKSLCSKNIPEYLKGAIAWRLLPSGLSLILITLFITGMGMAFAPWWPMDEYRESELKEFTAYHIAYSQLHKTKNGKPLYPKVTKDDDVYKECFSFNQEIRLEYGDDGERFTIHMLPYGIPIFPYNYLTSARTYRVDETGKIRMILVHKKNELCPTDAPVVMEVGEEEIIEAIERWFK
jgi:hypothetical protein